MSSSAGVAKQRYTRRRGAGLRHVKVRVGALAHSLAQEIEERV